VDLFEDKTREISELSNVQYVEPLLIGVESWSDDTHPVFEYRDSKENAEILYYNYGAGEGYSVCLECGRADTNQNSLNGHTRLRGGKNEEIILFVREMITHMLFEIMFYWLGVFKPTFLK
jgi:hypothetical protein